MLIIGHRGASGYAPEHTFASWDLALELGADYLEQDLQLTRDGVLVVLHDETLDRTVRRHGQPCTGRVLDRTLADLCGCEAGSWFNAAHPEHARAEYACEPLPTLEAVLARYAPQGAAFYIETKQPESAPGMEEALVGLLERYQLLGAAASEWRVLVQSFSAASLQRLRALHADLPLIQLIEAATGPAEIAAQLATTAEYAVGIGPQHRDVDAALVAAAHAHGLAVHPYTVNDPLDLQRVMRAGVDGVFTDFADRVGRTRPPGEPRGRDARVAAAATSRSRRAGQAGAAG